MTTRFSAAVALYGAAALTTATAAQPAARPAADGDDAIIEEVVVISHPLSAEGLALASDVLQGRELARALESTLGETVGNRPGVHAAGFGQAASRPVIRGLSGPRVRLMEDRIDALDVSVTSADHAVTIEPFVADRIEVLKGASTLLYGAGAIGGVVDVHTGRIPHERSARPVSGRVELRRGDNGDRETAAGRLDGSVGPVAWHLDGFHRDADAYRIPGFAESRALRLAEADGDESSDRIRHRLPGSGLDVHGGAGGVSLVGARGFAGAAVSASEARYGLPGGHEEDDPSGGTGAAETPELDLDQTRIDLEAGLLDPLPGFTSLNLRVGINDYRHREIEPDGAVATVFDNEALEARVELNHGAVSGWAGAFGLQFTHRDFSAIGEEAFIAPVDTTSYGAFWVGERSFRRFDVEAGVRLGADRVDPSNGPTRRFTSYAASIGMVLPLGDVWSLGLIADLSARAPVAEELFSDGPHLATRAFEIGNADLSEERSLSVSANLRYAGARWSLDTSAYYNRFSDFIFEAPTGAVEDGLPVFVYAQRGARFVGLDLEARATAATWNTGDLQLVARFDTVSGELDRTGADDLPRIPPTRYALGLTARHGRLRASLDHTWVRAQNDTAAFELPTTAYRDLRAYAGIDLALGETAFTLFVQGRNLTDAEQRQHASFIKDFAPLPGRTVEAGVRARF